MERSDKSRNKAVSTDNTEDWITFRTLRNKVTEQVKKDKKNFMFNLYKDTEKNPKTLQNNKKSTRLGHSRSPYIPGHKWNTRVKSNINGK